MQYKQHNTVVHILYIFEPVRLLVQQTFLYWFLVTKGFVFGHNQHMVIAYFVAMKTAMSEKLRTNMLNKSKCFEL